MFCSSTDWLFQLLLRQVPTVLQQDREDSIGAVLDKLFTPCVQRQVQMAQTVQKTVELPQVKLLRSLVVFSRREQWKCLSFSHRQSLMMNWRQMGSF